MLSGINGALKNLYTLMRGLPLTDDDAFRHQISVGVMMEGRTELGFVPMMSHRGRLSVIADHSITHITTNTTTTLALVRSTADYDYLCAGLIVNTAVADAVASFQNYAGTELWKVSLATAGVITFPASIMCNKVETTGTSAADITIVGSDAGDINSAMKNPLS